MDKQPVVIDHEPVEQKIFVVDIEYKSSDTRRITDVIATVTDCNHTPEGPALVPYREYMIVQQKDGTSTYVNMTQVQQLTIGVQPNG